MGVKRRSLFLPVLLAPALLVLACSSVHIKTGPPTDAELTKESEDRGRELKVRWSDQLQQASPVQQAALMRGFLDSTTAQFFRFGYHVQDTWREGSSRKGTQLTDREVREGIEQANQFDLPLLEAYEDILEFGIELLLSSKYFETPVTDQFIAYRDLFYDVYNAVFYPNGGLEDYQKRLQEKEDEVKKVSENLAVELVRY